VGALVHCPVEEPTHQLLVEETYAGLWQLGKAGRDRFQGDVVAITGSSGKTTAKCFIAAALDAYAPPGSYNNHIGVPLALANLPMQVTRGVFEIGTNHPGEIEPLCQLVNPDVAVLLNVHQAHLENFPSQQALRSEKISIFNGLQDKSKAISEDLVDLGFGLTFGLSNGAHAQVKAVEGDLMTLTFLGRPLSARVPGGGLHRANTVAAMLLVLHLLDVDLEQGINLEDTLVPSGRGNVHQVANIIVVDDSYNANPDSMKAAIRGFSHYAAKRKILLLGEMLELGELSQSAHLELMIELAFADQIYCVGEGMALLADEVGATWCENADEALLNLILKELDSGDAVLVKGSNRVFWQHGFVDRLLMKLQPSQQQCST